MCVCVCVKILKTKQLSGISIAIISETKISKNQQSFIFGFQHVAKNIEVWSKICPSYMVYSQIWLHRKLPYKNTARTSIYLFLVVNFLNLAKKEFARFLGRKLWKSQNKIGRFQQISHFLGFLQFFCPCFLLINCQILILRSNTSPKYNRIPNFFYFSICLVAKFS